MKTTPQCASYFPSWTGNAWRNCLATSQNHFAVYFVLTFLVFSSNGCNNDSLRKQSDGQTGTQDSKELERQPDGENPDSSDLNKSSGFSRIASGTSNSGTSNSGTSSGGISQGTNDANLGKQPHQHHFASFQLRPDTTILELDKKITLVQLAQICEHQQLETLILDGGIEAPADLKQTGAASIHLKKIINLKQLVHLRIRNFKVGDHGIQLLSKLTKLRILNSPQANFSDAAMIHLADMPNLELLRFSSKRVTDAGIKELSKSKSLRALHLIRINVSDVIVPSICAIQSLETFYIDGSLMTDKGYTKLMKLRPDLHLHVDQIHLDYDPRKH